MEGEKRPVWGRLWTDADYYYEEHVDNVWSIIISVLLKVNEREIERERESSWVRRDLADGGRLALRWTE